MRTTFFFFFQKSIRGSRQTEDIYPHGSRINDDPLHHYYLRMCSREDFVRALVPCTGLSYVRSYCILQQRSAPNIFLQPMLVKQVAWILEGYAYTHRIWSYNM